MSRKMRKANLPRPPKFSTARTSPRAFAEPNPHFHGVQLPKHLGTVHSSSQRQCVQLRATGFHEVTPRATESRWHIAFCNAMPLDALVPCNPFGQRSTACHPMVGNSFNNCQLPAHGSALKSFSAHTQQVTVQGELSSPLSGRTMTTHPQTTTRLRAAKCQRCTASPEGASCAEINGTA